MTLKCGYVIGKEEQDIQVQDQVDIIPWITYLNCFYNKTKVKSNKGITKKFKRSRTRLFNPFDGSSKPTIQIHTSKKHKKVKHKALNNFVEDLKY